jgi:hypothetical protein
MKNFKNLLQLLPLAVATLLFITVSCTKEGPQGPPGEDGVDGADGNATCGQCHDFSETIKAKMVQWEASLHRTGGTFERNGTSCAPCHVSKGFREVLETGLQATAEAISNPTPVNCYTCHNIHQTYESADWALASTAPVTHWQGGTVYDGGGNGNLCANCHQSRVTDPFPDAGNPGGNFEITSFRFGPHHGPQSNLLLGVGGYGVAARASHPHFNADNGSCIGCHMAEPFGSQAGGHNMAVVYDYHGGDHLLVEGCLACHTDEDQLLENTEEFYAEIEADMAELWQMLVDAGVGDPDNATYAVTGTHTNAAAGAFYNFKYIEEDKSKGLHNPTYTRNMIDAAKSALSGK